MKSRKNHLLIDFFKVLAIAVTLMSVPHSVKASEGVIDLLQTTCIPELNYFSLQSVELSRDLPNENTIDASAFSKMLGQLQLQNQLYTAEALLKKPYVCKLADRTISVKIEDYVAPHERGECALIENFNVSLSVDDKSIYKFSPYGINRCTGPETHIISLDAFNNFKDCEIEEFGSKKSCKSKKFLLQK